MNRRERSTFAREPDWDALSAAVSDAYFPHDLQPLGAGGDATEAVDADVSVIALGPLRIARIGWGAEVSVESDHPGAFGINIPLGGVLETRVAGRSVTSTNGFATVNPPDTPARITRWSESCTILGVRIDHDYLRRQVSRVTGCVDTEVPGQLDLRSGEARSWLRLVNAVAEQPDDDPLLGNPAVADRIAGLLTDGFVVAVSATGPAQSGPLRPRIVSRVIEALHADPGRSWTAADMAEIAGVSVRRLQEGFRDHVGRSPREYLTEVRLEAVHAELSSAAATTVTDAALRWGFTHSGRFSAAFRARFGVTPSQVLAGR